MNFPKPYLQKIALESISAHNIELSVLREDLVHSFLSGNKWRKLKYNLEYYSNSGKKAILTFGGKYSNHLIASAAAGKLLNIPMIGILRGEENVSNSNIDFLQKCGMNLLSISRQEYRLREDGQFLEGLYDRCTKLFPELISKTSDIFMIPEGGSNLAGVKGCTEIMNEIPLDTTHICVACGTGATLAGIASVTASHQKAIGIAVLRGENFLLKSVLEQGVHEENTEIIFDYHFGAYANTSEQLVRFISNFSTSTHIPLEPVYTGKLFFGIMDLISKKYFPENSKIVIIHSGGIFDFSKNLEI